MFRRVLSPALAVILLQGFFFGPSFANSKVVEEARLTEKVTAAIAKLGMGKETRVEIRLRDKKKLAGYVDKIGDESFGVTDLKTGTSTVVSYANVTQVKGHHLSQRACNILFVAILVGMFVSVGIFGGGDR